MSLKLVIGQKSKFHDFESFIFLKEISGFKRFRAFDLFFGKIVTFIRSLDDHIEKTFLILKFLYIYNRFQTEIFIYLFFLE